MATPKAKNIYFLSDAHLGSLAIDHGRTHERRLVSFLENIRHRAAAIYLLGDLFDFWFEYRTVVPKGFTRLLGKLSELTDQGVEVHFFTGNHDMWCGNYLTEECGLIMHRGPVTTEIYGNLFYLGHGDGLGDDDRKFAFLRSVFRNRVVQRLFAALHPRWGVSFGREWAKHSRLKRIGGKEPDYQGEAGEPLVRYAKQTLLQHPNINYFLFGHRHIMLDLMLTHSCRMMILGDWIQYFSYAVFDGEHLFLEQYVEGESYVSASSDPARMA